MSEQVAFEQPVSDGRIRETLHLPGGDGDTPVPLVLICEGIEPNRAAIDDLWQDLTAALVEQGVAVARSQPRCNELIHEDYHAYTANDHLQDLTVTLEWLAKHPAVNTAYIGGLGFGAGGATVALLAARTERIARLCLLNASSTGEFTSAEQERDDASADAGQFDENPPRAYAQSLTTLAPLDALRAVKCPALLLHAAADRAVDPDELVKLAEAATEGGADVERCLIARADHQFSHPITRLACTDRVTRFFVKMRSTAPSPQH